MGKRIQPAEKSYFVEQGYADLKEIIKKAWANNTDTINEYIRRAKVAGPGAFKKILMGIVCTGVVVAVAVFGSLFTFVLSLLHVLFLAVVMVVVCVTFSVVWVIDRLYLAIHRISVVCPEDQSKFLFPVYVCECGARHDRLTPGVYGIFHRTCTGPPGGAGCGRVLPTSVLNRKNRRSDMECICPTCLEVGKVTVLNPGFSRPLCVAVVGGASVGKSAFITAYANHLIDNVAPAKDLEIDWYDSAIERKYKTMQSHYRQGRIEKTRVQTDPNKPSSVPFNFFIRGAKLRPERMMYLYDIAGETFTENTENELPRQYEHCHGIVLIIDPLSIPMVMGQYGAGMAEADRTSASPAGIDRVVGNFIIKLQETTGLSPKNLMKTPLAVVINKVDIAPLKASIGKNAIESAMKAQPEVFNQYYDTMDHLCRKFLYDMGAGSAVDYIQMNFKTSRFFSASAIGHTVNEGQYAPENVTAVMDWIVNRADKPLSTLITTEHFTNVKLPIQM